MDIPCIEEVIVSVYELDAVYSDASAIRFSCATLGPITQDFALAPYSINAENGEIDLNSEGEFFYNAAM